MQNWANVRENRREGAASRYGHFSARESLRRDRRRNQSGSSRENARHSSALRGSSFSPSLPPRERARIELAPRDNTQRATTHCAERKMHARRTKGYKRKREREREELTEVDTIVFTDAPSAQEAVLRLHRRGHRARVVLAPRPRDGPQLNLWISKDLVSLSCTEFSHS